MKMTALDRELPGRSAFKGEGFPAPRRHFQRSKVTLFASQSDTFGPKATVLPPKATVFAPKGGHSVTCVNPPPRKQRDPLFLAS